MRTIVSTPTANVARGKIRAFSREGGGAGKPDHLGAGEMGEPSGRVLRGQGGLVRVHDRELERGNGPGLCPVPGPGAEPGGGRRKHPPVPLVDRVERARQEALLPGRPARYGRGWGLGHGRRRGAADADRFDLAGHQGVPNLRYRSLAPDERFRRRCGFEIDPAPRGHQARRSRWTM